MPTLWHRPLKTRVTVAVVFLIAALVLAFSSRNMGSVVPPTCLITAALLTQFVCWRIDRQRREGAEDARRLDLASIWTFAAALSCSLWWTAVVSVVVIGAQYPLVRDVYRGQWHRFLYTVCAVLLSAAGAHYAHQAVPFIAPAVTYFMLNWALIALAMLSDGADLKALKPMLNPADNLVEIGGLMLGAAVGREIISSLILVVCAAPAVLIIQHILVRVQLKRDTTPVEAVTHRAWVAKASARLRADHAGILILTQADDLLEAATVVRRAFRHDDDISLHDGLTWIFLTENGDPDSAAFLAKRARTCLAENGIPAVVGHASSPTVGTTLDDLIIAALAEIEVNRSRVNLDD